MLGARAKSSILVVAACFVAGLTLSAVILRLDSEVKTVENEVLRFIALWTRLETSTLRLYFDENNLIDLRDRWLSDHRQVERALVSLDAKVRTTPFLGSMIQDKIELTQRLWVETSKVLAGLDKTLADFMETPMGRYLVSTGGIRLADFRLLERSKTFNESDVLLVVRLEQHLTTLLTPAERFAHNVNELSVSVQDRVRELRRILLWAAAFMTAVILVATGRSLWTIKNINRMLQEVVAARTREIQSILKNIKQGIFMIGRDGYRIHEAYSDYSKTLLGTEKIGNETVFDVLFRRSDLPPADVAQMRSVLSAILGEPNLSFELNSHQIVRELRVDQGGADHQILELDWNPIVDAAGNVEKLLVSVRDVTEMRRLRERERAHAKELKQIGEIIHIPPRDFRALLVDGFSLVENATVLLQAALLPDLSQIVHGLHTLKGMARAYRLSELTDLVHQIETAIFSTEMPLSIAGKEQVIVGLQTIAQLLREYEAVNTFILDRGASLGADVDGSDAVVDGMLAVIEKLSPHTTSAELVSHIASLRHWYYVKWLRSLEQLIFELFESAKHTAVELGKSAPILTVHGGRSLSLSRRAEQVVSGVLVHLLHNIFDHSLESAINRLKLAKPEAGSVSVFVQEMAEQIEMRIVDDGQGVDLEKLRFAAQAKGIVGREATLTEAELLELVFVPGFSTKLEANSVSGRGVGLAAARESLRSIGGDLKLVRLAAGLEATSFAFVIYLPLSVVIKRPEEFTKLGAIVRWSA